MTAAQTTRARRQSALIAQAAVCKTRFPWERGLRREAFIKRRDSSQTRPSQSQAMTA